jgi:hypothetical protein
MGVTSALEALRRSEDTRQLTLTTKELAGNTTHDINIGEESDKVDSITFSPQGSEPASEGILFVVRPIVESGSTDTDFKLFEGPDRDPIDEYLGISGLSSSDPVSTFQPGSGTGVQFEAQDGSNRFFLRLVENSNTDSVYKIRMRWVDLKILP